MEWEIQSFIGMGPLRFGMTPDEVQQIIGAPKRVIKGMLPGRYKESRDVDLPILHYRDGSLTEINAFYDVPNVTLRGINIFADRGIDVMRGLERLNGSAYINVGIVLFKDIGVTVGRLDETVREEYSITAFKLGLWTGDLSRFKKISFI